MVPSHNFDLSLPPPAYSEQEFDQKISLASAQSLIPHQNQVEREGMWEVWDDGQFEEAAATLKKLKLQGSVEGYEAQGITGTPGQASNSSLGTPTQPLRIHKKSPSKESSSVPAGKPKPSWLADAERDTLDLSSSRVPLLAVPASSSSGHLEASTGGLSPVVDLPNPYASQDWGISSQPPPLPDPRIDRYEQELQGSSDTPPTLHDDSLPPPPFSSDEGQQVAHFYSVNMQSQPSPSLPVTLSPQPPSTGGSASPAYSPNPSITDLNLGVQSVAHEPRMLNSNRQSRSAVHSMPPPSSSSALDVPHTLRPNLPSQPMTSPNRYRDPYPNRHSTLPQTMPPPQVNVDLSAVYGKREEVKAVHHVQPVQAFNAAAFYNSAVSAHLTPTYPNSAANTVDPRRQSLQPTSMSSMYNLPQTSQSMAGSNGHIPCGPTPSQSLYNPRPRSYHPTLQQDPMIRSPTPTYAPGAAANPMSQMLAVANENRLVNQIPKPFSTNRGQVTWTEPFISRR